MNAKHIIAITVIVAAVSSVATALLMQDGDVKTPQPELAVKGSLIKDNSHPQEKESDRLLKTVLLEMEKLRAQVGKLEQQQAATQMPNQNGLHSAEAELAGAPLSPEAVVKQREVLVKRHKDILENSLRQEEKDAQWAENAQAKLSSTYSAATAKGVRFVEADCRSTMCKMQMALDQPGKKGEIQLRRLMDSPTPWSGTRFMQMNKQTGEAVVYMMREGHDLPSLPPETNGN